MDAAFYRIEINLVYLAVLCIVEFFGERKEYGTNRVATQEILFRWMIILSACICISDMITLCLEGNMHAAVYAVLQICHGMFYLFSTAIGYLWFLYVLTQFQKTTFRKCIFYTIPFLFFAGIVFTNCMHNRLFIITEDHCYDRGKWVGIHWVICGFYMLLATGVTVLQLVKEKSYRKRKLIYPFLFFIIPPIITALLQVVFEGNSILQGGFTLSLLMIQVSEKEKSIYTDILTGIGNRRGLYHYIDRCMRVVPQNIHCMVIDMDHFKEINDNFGHDTGDQVLVDAVLVLTKVCSEWSGDYYICRYGGDEFVIVLRDCTQEQIYDIQKRIVNYAEEIHTKKEQSYPFSFSIGISGMLCYGIEDVETVISDADRKMYMQKRSARMSTSV